MTIYFTASIVGKKHYLLHYHTIIAYLKGKKHTVISDHIIDASESKIHMETKEDRLKFQERLDTWINSADLVIAETSFPSISVGYEISLALSRGKPVLILFSEGHPPSLLAHHKDERLVCEKYSKDTVGAIIDDFINYIRGTDDMRFTFFITPQIATYLDQVSRKEKFPKSVYLRKLIEKEMSRKG